MSYYRQILDLLKEHSITKSGINFCNCACGWQSGAYLASSEIDAYLMHREHVASLLLKVVRLSQAETLEECAAHVPDSDLSFALYEFEGHPVDKPKIRYVTVANWMLGRAARIRTGNRL